MENRNPSMWRVLWTDYWAFVGLMLIVVVGAFWGFSWLTAPGPTTLEMTPFALGIMLLGFVLIVWRLRLISSTFEDGRQVEGVVTEVSYFRDRCRVAYLYHLDGQRYQASTVVMRQRKTQVLEPGRPVVIVADRDNPQRAFLRDLYR